jgi:hypothetical protein
LHQASKHVHSKNSDQTKEWRERHRERDRDRDRETEMHIMSCGFLLQQKTNLGKDYISAAMLCTYPIPKPRKKRFKRASSHKR